MYWSERLVFTMVPIESNIHASRLAKNSSSFEDENSDLSCRSKVKHW